MGMTMTPQQRLERKGPPSAMEVWQRALHVAWQKARPKPMPKGEGRYQFFTSFDERNGRGVCELWRCGDVAPEGCENATEDGLTWHGVRSEALKAPLGQDDADEAVRALFARFEG
jgi:hypothetical protein